MSTAEMYKTAGSVASTATLGRDVRVVVLPSPESPVAWGTTDDAERRHAALIEDLIAWSTDPNSIDRQALENVHQDGWGIGR